MLCFSFILYYVSFWHIHLIFWMKRQIKFPQIPYLVSRKVSVNSQADTTRISISSTANHNLSRKTSETKGYALLCAHWLMYPEVAGRPAFTLRSLQQLWPFPRFHSHSLGGGRRVCVCMQVWRQMSKSLFWHLMLFCLTHWGRPVIQPPAQSH